MSGDLKVSFGLLKLIIKWSCSFSILKFCKILRNARDDFKKLAISSDDCPPSPSSLLLCDTDIYIEAVDWLLVASYDTNS